MGRDPAVFQATFCEGSVDRRGFCRRDVELPPRREVWLAPETPRPQFRGPTRANGVNPPKPDLHNKEPAL